MVAEHFDAPEWSYAEVKPGSPVVRLTLRVNGEVRDIDTLDITSAGRRGVYAERMREMFPDRLDVADRLLAIAEEVVAGGRPAAFPMPRTMSAVFDEWASETSAAFVETGVAFVDRLLGGGLPQGLVALAGEPGGGKTALAKQTALSTLLLNEDAVVTWARGELTSRLFAARTTAVWSTMRDGLRPVTLRDARERSPHARAAAEDFKQTIGDRFFVIDPPLHIDAIEAAIDQTRPAVLVIDYLQLVVGVAAADRRLEIEDTTRRLANIATQSGVSVVVISNMSKASTREARIGSLSRESNRLDYDADAYLVVGAGDISPQTGNRDATLKLLKSRTSPIGDVALVFDGSQQRFYEEIAPHEEFAAFGMKT